MISLVDEKIVAVIITFNPEIDQLCQNAQRIASQVDELIIYDNCSNNIEDIKNELPDIHIVQNDANIGLPINYNRAVSLAKTKGYKWLLIMDQDTLIPDNLIEEYQKYTSWDKVAIICPQFWDINLNKKEEFMNEISNEDFSYVDKCISSASLNNVDIAVELGGFDEKMFIDYVDSDYCRNCINHGYKILRSNKCIIEHQIGKAKTVIFLGRQLTSYNHPPCSQVLLFQKSCLLCAKVSR